VDGVWNKTGATLTLNVRPHFWQTWWFGALAVMGVLISVGGGIRFVEKRKIQTQMRQLEHERTLERERARIAQDLHDDLGASLSRISLLSDMAKANHAKQPGNGEGHVEKISELAGQTLRALDEIVWAVRPGSDSLQSLVEYIAHFANEMFKGNGVRCRLDLPDHVPDRSLPPEMRHNIFLVAKEALTNSMRHAFAREICVQIKTTPDSFELMIKDDGRGFNPTDAANVNDGNGLANMRHRAEAMAGHFELQALPGKGTVMHLSVGLSASEAASKRI
jgi:signal transduction histidine kinase